MMPSELTDMCQQFVETHKLIRGMVGHASRLIREVNGARDRDRSLIQQGRQLQSDRRDAETQYFCGEVSLDHLTHAKQAEEAHKTTLKDHQKHLATMCELQQAAEDSMAKAREEATRLFIEIVALATAVFNQRWNAANAWKFNQEHEVSWAEGVFQQLLARSASGTPEGIAALLTFLHGGSFKLHVRRGFYIGNTTEGRREFTPNEGPVRVPNHLAFREAFQELLNGRVAICDH